MTPDAFEHVLYQLINAPLREYPFDHLYVNGVFPEDYYQELLTHLPEEDKYIPIEKLGKVSKGSYLERSVFPLLPKHVDKLDKQKVKFWKAFMSLFMSEAFQEAALFLFSDGLEERFASSKVKPEFEWTVDLVRDTSNYSIGPHTDSPHKALTFLFYLPKDVSFLDLGTSLFSPKDLTYSDPEGRHHSFEGFKVIKTMPFKPNSVFGFCRSDTSWHGVLPLKERVERHSLAFQLVVTNLLDL